MGMCTRTCTYFDFQCQSEILDLQLPKNALAMLSLQSFSNPDEQCNPYFSLNVNAPAQVLVFSITFVQAASPEGMLKSDAEPQSVVPVQKSHCCHK